MLRLTDSKGLSKPLIIGISLLVVLIILIPVGWWRYQAVAEETEKVYRVLNSGEGRIIPDATMDMDDFMISSRDQGIIQCKIQLGLSTSVMYDEMRRKVAIVRDVINRELSSHTVSEINEAYRTQKLHNNIRRALNEEMTEENGWFTTGVTLFSGITKNLARPRKVISVNFHEFMAR